MNFIITIADHVFRIESLYEEVFRLCKDYQTPDKAWEWQIVVTEKDIAYERDKTMETALAGGGKTTAYSDGYLETLSVYRKIAGLLQKEKVMLFHGCVVAVENEAYLFTAPSGTGKSTHAKLWVKNIPHAKIINGDKPLLKVEDGQVTAYGSPWNGKEGWGENAAVLLKAICFLERGKTNAIRPVALKEVVPDLIKQSIFSGDCDLHRILEMIAKMDHLGFYRLQCNMEDEAAWVSYRALSGQRRVK